MKEVLISKRDVRSDVLEAVYDVCERFGLENLTTKKLGEEAHCSEAMIYYHFKVQFTRDYTG